MIKTSYFIIILSLLICISFVNASDDTLMIMVGAASKPAAEELIEAYTKKTGIKIDASYGGSGVLLTQLQLAKKGDLYFPGSIDFIDKAKSLDLIYPETVTPVVYLVPAINVHKGNPHKIHSLKDLCKPGLRIILGNPECVCLGVFAVELAETRFSKDEMIAFRKNIINYTTSCSKVATSISLKSADAVIGWNVFKYWDPKRIESIKLSPDELIRVSYLSIAITKYCKNRKLAQDFISFMTSNEGMKYFSKFKYFTTSKDALDFVGKKIPVGGKTYELPDSWK
ncbi:extracellular solute-binding protein [bacterium]|nr:extracellular solute-binding protein [bacterium]